MWLDVPKAAIEILNSRRMNVAGAIHAAEHAILSLLPQFVISMPGDVRTECKNALKVCHLPSLMRTMLLPYLLSLRPMSLLRLLDCPISATHISLSDSAGITGFSCFYTSSDPN